MSVPLPQLSCQQCQRRKIRCDKNTPCDACKRASIECTAVQRHRLPRGRSGKRAAAHEGNVLRERVARLEAVVTRMQAETSPAHLSNAGARPAVETLVAPDFWSELTETVAGLRDVLESPESGLGAEDSFEGVNLVAAYHSEHAVNHDGSNAFASDSHTLLFGNELDTSAPTVRMDTGPWLLEIYKDRVDAIFKVLHWPSILALFSSYDRPDNSQDLSALEAQTLVAAMQFTATCALFDHELPDRQQLVKERRLATEGLFVKVGLLTSTNFMVLQALVIYLAGLRACQASAQQWTLTATAVRIANAQGIPFAYPTSSSVLDVELRRRVWQTICLLDMQSALDRGSRPMISSRDMGSCPLHINDADIGPTSDTVPTSQDHFSEMTFSLLVCRAGFCQRRMTEIGLSAFGGDMDHAIAVDQQRATLADFERESERLIQLCDKPPISSQQKFIMAVAAESVVAMRLLIYRPLHKRAQPLTAPVEDFNILGVALNVLERSRDKRSRAEFAQWAWFSWVKWYALAVVLAELCGARGKVANHAWGIVQQCFDDYANAVADSRSGLLWQPIARLMSKVRALRSSQQTAQVPESGSRALRSQPAPSLPPLSEHPTKQPGGAILEGGLIAEPIDEYLAWVNWDLLIDDIDTFGSYDM